VDNLQGHPSLPNQSGARWTKPQPIPHRFYKRLRYRKTRNSRSRSGRQGCKLDFRGGRWKLKARNSRMPRQTNRSSTLLDTAVSDGTRIGSKNCSAARGVDGWETRAYITSKTPVLAGQLSNVQTVSEEWARCYFRILKTPSKRSKPWVVPRRFYGGLLIKTSNSRDKSGFGG
jgi:hypothetical protein